jgi:hypothetical protein
MDELGEHHVYPSIDSAVDDYGRRWPAATSVVASVAASDAAAPFQ